jgi:hypothetical protein
MGCKMKPGKKGAVAGAALAVLCLGSAAAFADITYIVDQTVTDGSKTGTVVGIITTDGALGTLLPSDFKSWNLELTGVGAIRDGRKRGNRRPDGNPGDRHRARTVNLDSNASRLRRARARRRLQGREGAADPVRA